MNKEEAQQIVANLKTAIEEELTKAIMGKVLTPTVRAEVETIMKSFLPPPLRAVCDHTNNTPQTIAENKLVMSFIFDDEAIDDLTYGPKTPSARKAWMEFNRALNSGALRDE